MDEPVPDQSHTDASRPEMVQDQPGRRSVVRDGRFLPEHLSFGAMFHKGRLRTGHAYPVGLTGNDNLRLPASGGLKDLVTEGGTSTVEYEHVQGYFSTGTRQTRRNSAIAPGVSL